MKELIMKQVFEEDFTQRLKEGNIIRLKPSRLRHHRHRLRPQRLRLSWLMPHRLEPSRLRLSRLRSHRLKLSEVGVRGGHEIIYSSISRKKANTYLRTHSSRRQSYGTRRPVSAHSNSRSTQRRHWMWTGRRTCRSPRVRPISAFTSANWVPTNQLRHSRDTRTK